MFHYGYGLKYTYTEGHNAYEIHTCIWVLSFLDDSPSRRSASLSYLREFIKIDSNAPKLLKFGMESGYFPTCYQVS